MELDEEGKPFKTSNFEATKIPKKIDIGNEKAVDIASGSHHILILTDNGNVYTFGEGDEGQLGRISLKDLGTIKKNRELFLKPGLVTFKRLEVSEKITKIFAGHWSSYALTSLGNVYGWGLNNFYQLGFESTSPITIPDQPEPRCFELVPVKISLNFKVQQISAGQKHLVLLDDESYVYSCGQGLYGLLGLSQITSNRSAQDFKTPQLIERERFHGEEIHSIACGDFYTLALTKNGTVFFWGQAGAALGFADDAEDAHDVFRPSKYVGPVIEAYRILQLSPGTQFAAFIGERL